jgi:hypothetical protein
MSEGLVIQTHKPETRFDKKFLSYSTPHRLVGLINDLAGEFTSNWLGPQVPEGIGFYTDSSIKYFLGIFLKVKRKREPIVLTIKWRTFYEFGFFFLPVSNNPNTTLVRGVFRTVPSVLIVDWIDAEDKFKNLWCELKRITSSPDVVLDDNKWQKKCSEEDKKPRKGGPQPIPDDLKMKYIDEWLANPRFETQEHFCLRHGIGTSTLRGYIR